MSLSVDPWDRGSSPQHGFCELLEDYCSSAAPEVVETQGSACQKLVLAT
jgi:hypothetical protein